MSAKPHNEQALEAATDRMRMALARMEVAHGKLRDNASDQKAADDFDAACAEAREAYAAMLAARGLP